MREPQRRSSVKVLRRPCRCGQVWATTRKDDYLNKATRSADCPPEIPLSKEVKARPQFFHHDRNALGRPNLSRSNAAGFAHRRQGYGILAQQRYARL